MNEKAEYNLYHDCRKFLAQQEEQNTCFFDLEEYAVSQSKSTPRGHAGLQVPAGSERIKK